MATQDNGALSYFTRGLRIIFRPGMLRYMVIPLSINILVFASLFGVSLSYFNDLVEYLLTFLPDWLGFLSYLFWIMFAVVAAVILYFGFSLLANVIGAPFNGPLAAAVEKQLTGQYPQGAERPLRKEVLVAMASELRKWGYYLMFAIPLFLICLVPLITPFSPIIWFVFGAWMYSLEYAEYPMGNHGLTFVQVRKQLRNRRILSLSFGAVITLASMVPVLNLLVMPAAVAGATIMRVEQFPLGE